MAPTIQSCHRCHRVNPPAARFCGLCGVELPPANRTTHRRSGFLHGLVWLLIIGFLLTVFLVAIGSMRTRRSIHNRKAIWPGHRIILQDAHEHQH